MEDYRLQLLNLLNQFDEEELAMLSKKLRAVTEDGCDLPRMLADFDIWMFEKRNPSKH